MFWLLSVAAVLGAAQALTLNRDAALRAAELQLSRENDQAARELSSALAQLAALSAGGRRNATAAAAPPAAPAAPAAAAAANATAGGKAAPVVSPVLGANVSAAVAKERESLQNLFAHLKDRIAKSNADEAANKARNEQAVAKLQERLQREREQLNSTKLSKFDRELLTNRTRMDERELEYFTRGRELQRGMFHTNLRVTHSLMNHVKTVLDVYQEFLANGKLSPELEAKMKAVSSSLPKA